MRKYNRWGEFDSFRTYSAGRFLDPEAFLQACAPTGGRTCDMSHQLPQQQEDQGVNSSPASALGAGKGQGSRSPSPHASLNAGYTLLASVIIGLGLGYAVDVWLETAPWCSVGGAALFIVAGLYQVVKEAQR